MHLHTGKVTHINRIDKRIKNSSCSRGKGKLSMYIHMIERGCHQLQEADQFQVNLSIIYWVDLQAKEPHHLKPSFISLFKSRSIGAFGDIGWLTGSISLSRIDRLLLVLGRAANGCREQKALPKGSNFSTLTELIIIRTSLSFWHRSDFLLSIISPFPQFQTPPFPRQIHFCLPSWLKLLS